MDFNLIDEVLNQDCLLEKPPLLVDVGASGDIHSIWKKIAKYSICLAFDPDERDLKITNQTGTVFKNFFMINRVVADFDGNSPFYLTTSPHCSSSLKTNLNNLRNYNIASRFEIKKEISLPSITIKTALENVGYNYIDWFKTDSQGTDLRIFTVLKDDIVNNILIAEFEPGIDDAYVGEDKLWKIMSYFEHKDFWCDECTIKGMSRISENIINEKLNYFENKFLSIFHKNSSFWAEISYMNSMKYENFSKRDFLLMSVFAIVKEQYGFACEICIIAQKKFSDNIFQKISNYSISRMKRRGYIKLPFYLVNRIINRVKRNFK